MTTLMEAPAGAAAGLEKEFGGCVEIDNASPLHARVDNFAKGTPLQECAALAGLYPLRGPGD